ncbi:hypothetical protein WK78_03025 [Burkholderia cepacia]|uniref:hypothetical protein n=1 Tax=Burkholderia cepacia TaxID=292 RepID=UPI00075C48CB|nr:hypothetical protein [Burkholderia cepacia]KVV25081.1 hypothetical protein WK78_03025 [Burkholderia cepacia]
MTLDEKAAALVAAVSPADVRALIASVPPAECIGARSNWLDIPLRSDKALPKDAAKRAEFLAAELEAERALLDANRASYSLLRDSGLGALSTYDICISSGGDPLGALRMALRLKFAHVTYNLALMVKLKLLLDDAREVQRKSEAEASAQLGLF